MQSLHLLSLLVLVAVFRVASGQELEPRAYSNAPVGMNFVVAGYGHTEGNLLFDPSVPIDNASAKIDAGLFGAAHSFGLAGKSAKVALVLPVVALDAVGDVNGVRQSRKVTGLADPTLAFSFNFSGAPALNMEEFRRYRQETIVGATLKVTAPVGQYDDDRLVNIGTNRWSFRPEIGISRALGSWIIEGTAAAAFYATNDDFFGGQRLEQDPIYAGQAHIVYDIRPGLWVALDATYYTGGTSTIEGQRKNNELHNWRVGLTLAVPLNRHHSIKIAASSGISARAGSDFDAYALVWQYRWGGGF
ncbi:MAG TPA: transporter [Povalibacter sp.]